MGAEDPGFPLGSRAGQLPTLSLAVLLLSQDHDVPALRPEFRAETEIIVPANEFETAAQLGQAQEFLREEDLRRHTAGNDELVSAVIDAKRQALVISLRDESDH